MLPRVYESVTLTSPQDVAKLASVVHVFGQFVKRITVRWEHSGLLRFGFPSENEPELSRNMSIIMLNLRNVVSVRMDFPGSFVALYNALSSGNEQTKNLDISFLPLLQDLYVRNGHCYFYPANTNFLLQMAKLQGLTSLTIDGNCANDDTLMPSGGTVSHNTSDLWQAAVPIRIPSRLDNNKPIFPQLVHLDISSLAGFDDQLLEHILLHCGQAVRDLGIKTCPMITLAGMVAILDITGINLEKLDLSVLKYRSQQESMLFRKEEHLCPVIRRCINLKVANIYTNKLCQDIFYKPVTNDYANTSLTQHNLPTPPQSPGNVFYDHMDTFVNVTNLTPPCAASGHRLSVSSDPSAYLPEPQFKIACTLSNAPQFENISLRIPWDASSLITRNAGGPSLQQTETSLCHGEPAEELLHFTERAFNDGIIGKIAKVTGWSKFGPHLLMRDD